MLSPAASTEKRTCRVPFNLRIPVLKLPQLLDSGSYLLIDPSHCGVQRELERVMSELSLQPPLSPSGC